VDEGVEQRSPFEQAKVVDASLHTILSRLDLDGESRDVRDLADAIRQLSTDARLDTRDYDYAETRAEQQKIARECRERFEQLRQLILKASEHNMFGVVDVAELSARIEHIMANVQ
jgi:hypothetical protein